MIICEMPPLEEIAKVPPNPEYVHALCPVNKAGRHDNFAEMDAYLSLFLNRRNTQSAWGTFCSHLHPRRALGYVTPPMTETEIAAELAGAGLFNGRYEEARENMPAVLKSPIQAPCEKLYWKPIPVDICQTETYRLVHESSVPVPIGTHDDTLF